MSHTIVHHSQWWNRDVGSKPYLLFYVTLIILPLYGIGITFEPQGVTP